MGSFTHLGVTSPFAKHHSSAPAKSTHKIDDETDHQNQTEPAATDRRSAEVKSTATEQEQKNEDE
jgi:hypothetical protein